MATLPKSGAASCEEQLEASLTGSHEAHPAGRPVKPRRFPGVQVDIARIWPD